MTIWSGDSHPVGGRIDHVPASTERKGPAVVGEPFSYPERMPVHQMSSSASGPVIISSATFSVR
jgi:hypothetical protein